jgi:hypothetical protein
MIGGELGQVGPGWTRARGALSVARSIKNIRDVGPGDLLSNEQKMRLDKTLKHSVLTFLDSVGGPLLLRDFDHLSADLADMDREYLACN